MKTIRVFQSMIVYFLLFSSCQEPKSKVEIKNLDKGTKHYVDYEFREGRPASWWRYYDFYGNMLMEIDYSLAKNSETFKIYHFSINKYLISYQYYVRKELFHSFSFEHSDYQDLLKGKVLFKKFCSRCHDLQGRVIGPALIPYIEGSTVTEGIWKLEKGMNKPEHEESLKDEITLDSLDLLFLVKYIQNGGMVRD